MSTPEFIQIKEFADRFIDNLGAINIKGIDFGLPKEVIAFQQATYKLPTGGRLEVNRTTRAANELFDWRYEITIDDAANEVYKHVLLMASNKIVETYGKKVLDVSQPEAQGILDQLETLFDPT